jgi:predicted transcriptional regulator
MPYRIKVSGHQVNAIRGPKWQELTDLQKEVLFYLDLREKEGERDFIKTRDIAYDLKMHPMVIMGAGHSLVVRGLVEKKE